MEQPLDRKKYWDETYFEYWTKRVEESATGPQAARSQIVKGDCVVPGDDIYASLLKEAGFRNGMILDVGCGWGRLFPLFAKLGLSICGVDISAKMIAEARKRPLSAVAELKEGECENLPFPSSYFDYACCFGVFDCTQQEKSLSEILRVLRIGGELLVTGKNANYCDSDDMAKAAEIGAYRKGEPNYFTNVPVLLKQLLGQNHIIKRGMYFLRRGDFSKSLFTEVMPDRFYEYCLIIRKGSESVKFHSFSNDRSLVRIAGESQ